MDSHLSNAQRCVRKADSLVKYGMYDEALHQLDKSIVYLHELKSFTTRYENIQMLNVQIESIDRKKRSVAIKRSESIKKKNKADQFLYKSSIRVQHVPASVKSSNKPVNKCDQSPVIIEYCYNNDTVNIKTQREGSISKSVSKAHRKTTLDGESMFVHGRKKLDKDDKSIIEELSTTNAEYKKVNSYLADEIEQLKRENSQLKVELIKIHLSDSLTSSDSSSITGQNLDNFNSTSTSTSTSTPKQSMRAFDVLGSNYDNNNVTSSSSSSSASSSSWSISNSNSSSSNVDSSQNSKHDTDIKQFKSIDLSKYIDNSDDDDNDDDDFQDHFKYDLFHHTDEDSDLSINNPPLEFTVDSV